MSKLLGINNSTIRFYERSGLIHSGGINREENGYRIYSRKDIDEIRLIIKFKEFGLELKDIKHLLVERTRTCGDLVTSLDEQLEKCRQMESLIKDRIAALMAAKNSCSSECEPGVEARKCCAS